MSTLFQTRSLIFRLLTFTTRQSMEHSTVNPARHTGTIPVLYWYYTGHTGTIPHAYLVLPPISEGWGVVSPRVMKIRAHFPNCQQIVTCAPFSFSLRTDSGCSTDAYASTYQTQGGENHTYQELENLSPRPTPHFALHTGHDSVRSLPGIPPHPSLPHNFVSGQVPWAASTQAPSDFGRGGGSLRHVATLHHSPISHPPVTSMPAMAVDHHRRASVPTRHLQEPKRSPLPKNTSFPSEPSGKSLPALPSYPPVSPPPLASPPTPEMTDMPVAYSTPHMNVPKPWYQSDYEPSTVSHKCVL